MIAIMVLLLRAFLTRKIVEGARQQADKGQQCSIQIIEESIRWNYTTVLNIIFLTLAAILIIRFLRTNGPEMLRMMSSSGHHEHTPSQHCHQDHDHHA
jgi:hypothetical protein